MHILPFLFKPCKIAGCITLAQVGSSMALDPSCHHFSMQVRKLLQITPLLFFYPQKGRGSLVLRN